MVYDSAFLIPLQLQSISAYAVWKRLPEIGEVDCAQNSPVAVKDASVKVIDFLQTGEAEGDGFRKMIFQYYTAVSTLLLSSTMILVHLEDWMLLLWR